MRTIIAPNYASFPDPTTIVPPLVAALNSAEIRVVKDVNMAIAADTILPNLDERTPGAPQIAKLHYAEPYSMVITTNEDFGIAPIFASDMSTGVLYVLQIDLSGDTPVLVWEETSASDPEEYISDYYEQHSVPPNLLVFDHQLQPYVVWG